MKSFIETFFLLFQIGADSIKSMFVTNIQQKGGRITQNKVVATCVKAYNVGVVGKTLVPVVSDAESINPESEHFQITMIRILDGAGAALGEISWEPGVSDAITKNGNLSITNNGLTELKEIPLTAFQAGDFAEAGTFNLLKPIFWMAQTPLIPQLKFPTATATVNQSLRVELWGMKTI